MNNPLRSIRWADTDKDVIPWLEGNGPVGVFPLTSGLEAEVIGIDRNGSKFVLKIWNRDSKPHIQAQYKLLKILSGKGLAVSEPIGWGTDPDGHSALLTRYGGTPIRKLNRSKLLQLANMLLDVHRLPLNDLGEGTVRNFPFIGYFFPAIDDHPDLRDQLAKLVDQADPQPTCLIHGDYNLGNVLEDGDRLAIIDWTNGQLGDPRYDIAWSVVLMRIYAGERNGSVYRNAFLAGSPYSSEELERFEAIACLRWLLLNRVAHLPKGKDTLGKVRKLLKENVHLDESLL
ncbi:phosphotransferase family protein [Cohnella zeiphila]|uniref:Aminoglycoside phosphotransferase family protein n=1 Tax=Cohnella zeiphila TaxID=2761120 RepID=A0A7X0SUH5_9BACL|nr:aminoglycoside phosphotransferase family protein [Cohnella zeiphila]MBB6735150.1 aminoglycoside phosphotransferase family protein [Cohnella zeiphila]